LLAALNALLQDTSYSASERADFKGLHDSFKTYISTQTDNVLRVQYFTEQVYQLLLDVESDIRAIYITEITGYGELV
jgi:hypothetical protein